MNERFKPGIAFPEMAAVLQRGTCILFFALVSLTGCSPSSPDFLPPVSSAGVRAPDSLEFDSNAVRTGAMVLSDETFERYRGKRIGLIVNHSALVRSEHLIDVIDRSPDVQLVALFGPEHGLRGTSDAGAEISHGRDPRTGIPVFSLYGETRKPTPEMLRNVDVLVFDIQDIGARFYTYISTMGLAMQAAAEAGLSFVVLDRPNPLGGDLTSGWILDEPDLVSFVGQYPIPVTHGLTVGELAMMIKGEKMLDGLENLHLEVVRMEGWRRDMLWPETGLPWIPPSPNIPEFETALVYPGTCFFEATSASEGRGTHEPFELIGAPWADGEALASLLNDQEMEGVRFDPVTFTPESIEGMSSNPKLQGVRLQGVRLIVTDASRYRPVEAGVHLIYAFNRQARDAGVADFISRPEWLAKLTGTKTFNDLLHAGAEPDAIIDTWKKETEAFRERRESYLLY